MSSEIEAVARAIRAAQMRLSPNQISTDSAFDDAHQMAQAILTELDTAGHRVEVKPRGCSMCDAGPNLACSKPGCQQAWMVRQP